MLFKGKLLKERKDKLLELLKSLKIVSNLGKKSHKF
jgi:hypothetical protein